MTGQFADYQRRLADAARMEVRWTGACPACGNREAVYVQRQSEPQARIWCGGCDR